MIDSHCHLEQRDYDKDRDEVIGRCRAALDAVVTCCAHPRDFEMTMQLVENNRGFIFASAGLHPEYVKNVSEKEKYDFIEKIVQNKERIVSIGETGLDYFWIKEPEWQKKQRELFIEFINLAKELKKPVTVHCRDAFDDTLNILENEDAKKVHLHMFGGAHLLARVVENGWMVSLNTIILKSKKYRKVARDAPLESMMLETDAPWLGENGRNEPVAVAKVAAAIAEIRGLAVEDVDRATTANAVRTFGLKIPQRG